MKISLGDLPRVRWLQVAQYCLGVFTLWLATSGHLVTVLAAEGITSEMNHPVRTVRINRKFTDFLFRVYFPYSKLAQATKEDILLTNPYRILL